MYLALMSNKLTNLLTNELNYSEDKKEVINYAIESILLFILGGFLIVLFGYVFKALLSAVTAAAFAGMLRKVSGGAHFNSPLKCTTFGAIVYSFIGVLAKNLASNGFSNKYIILTVVFVSFVLVSILAPVDSVNKPIHSSYLRLKLRLLSMLFVIITFLLVVFANNQLFIISAVLGVFYQSITLLPMFNQKGGEYCL